MKQDIAQKWTTALRSGDYTQCKGRLFNGESYCCLGVLSELYNEEHPTSPTNMKISVLSDEVRNWSGVRDLCGQNQVTRKFGPLTHMNDVKDHSFLKIADYIDEHWADL